MKHAIFSFIVLALFSFELSSQNNLINYKSTHKIYSGKGKEVGYFQMIESLKSADIILFGELHNNSMIHWLQLQTTIDLLKDSTRKIVLGAEMYSSDQQNEINEYLSGIVESKTFEKKTKQWNNYKTDYKPLMLLAKENNLSFIASNSPQKLSLIPFRKGIDSLYAINNDSILKLLAPLPLEIDFKAPGYNELMEMDFGSSHKMNTKNLVEAQALKDATMAHNILKNLNDGELFIHYNGDFHSKLYGGIGWYLKRYDKRKKVVTISSVENENCTFNNEDKKRADFIIVVPGDMAKSY